MKQKKNGPAVVLTVHKYLKLQLDEHVDCKKKKKKITETNYLK